MICSFGREGTNHADRLFLGPGRGIPEANGAIQAGRHQTLTIGTEHQALNPVGVSAQCQDQLAIGHVPDLCGVIRAAADQSLAIGAKGDRGDRRCVAMERVEDLCAGHIPDLDRAGPALQ